MSPFGKSLGFPPRVGSDGRMRWSEGETNIRESIRIVLSTDKGERIALPDFGAGLMRFLFEPNTTATHARIADAIGGALARWETRLAVESVDVAADPADRTSAIATISYRLVATGARERTSVAVPIGAAG
ncbi:MAG TPA: GPW/gp25 family protein [Allosphingosinicella sp.]|nr:GPW/gp25 family protein [Allosphingosinicella sp.]